MQYHFLNVQITIIKKCRYRTKKDNIKSENLPAAKSKKTKLNDSESDKQITHLLKTIVEHWGINY